MSDDPTSPAGLATETAPYLTADFKRGHAFMTGILAFKQRHLGAEETREWAAARYLNSRLPRTPYDAGLQEACREYLEENPTDE